MRKMTTREIARMAGVSPAAVSFALNGKKGISEETRKQILAIAREANYQPAGTGPRAEKQMNFAVVFRNYLPALDKLFYTELNNSVMQVCDDPSINLIMTSVQIENGEVTLPNALYTDNLDGIIVYGDLDRRIDQALNRLSVPTVVLDSSRRGLKNAVYVDYANAAYVATRYLIDLGHTDIAYLGNDRMHDFNLQTFGGFQRATTESGLQLSTDRIQLNVYDETSLTKCIDNVFRGAAKPTALFCAADCYAIHAIRHIHSLGMRVPEDVSIVGIDDIVISPYTIPSLTTIRVDRDRISELGLTLLKKQIAGEPCESVTLPLDELIVRESTAAPRQNVPACPAQ